MKNALRVLLLLGLLLPLGVQAGKGQVRFVETTVDLQQDGSAVVLYQIQWRVT